MARVENHSLLLRGSLLVLLGVFSVSCAHQQAKETSSLEASEPAVEEVVEEEKVEELESDKVEEAETVEEAPTEAAEEVPVVLKGKSQSGLQMVLMTIMH